jgi:hypothetical protein
MLPHLAITSETATTVHVRRKQQSTNARRHCSWRLMYQQSIVSSDGRTVRPFRTTANSISSTPVPSILRYTAATMKRTCHDINYIASNDTHTMNEQQQQSTVSSDDRTTAGSINGTPVPSDLRYIGATMKRTRDHITYVAGKSTNSTNQH